MFDLLAHGARQRLSPWLNERGGLKDVLSNFAPPQSEISISLQLRVEWWNGPITYILNLAPQGLGYAITKECLRTFTPIQANKDIIWIDNALGSHINFGSDVKQIRKDSLPGYNPQELVIGQPPHLDEKIDRFRQILSSTTYFRFLDHGADSPVRNAQILEPNILIPGHFIRG